METRLRVSGSSAQRLLGPGVEVHGIPIRTGPRELAMSSILLSHAVLAAFHHEVIEGSPSQDRSGRQGDIYSEARYRKHGSDENERLETENAQRCSLEIWRHSLRRHRQGLLMWTESIGGHDHHRFETFTV